MGYSNNANKCIGCTVRKCANHAKDTDFCTLQQVSIGTHEKDPKEPQCTDCESFVPQL